jgi:DNA-binding response OmpR family regulator
LLVTDNPSAAFAASHSLRAAGYEVKTIRLEQTPDRTPDPQIGKKLVRDPVELVLLDASHRPSQAVSLLEALRAADSTIPAIVIAGTDAETREEASRLGAEAVLDSPLDLSRLRAVAESLAPPIRDFDREVEARGYSFH